jgi:phage terminase large subunit-like protein
VRKRSPKPAVQAVVAAHVDALLTGNQPVNRWIRLAAERWIRDLERPELEMDWAAVDAAVGWIQTLELVGGHAGQRWALLPWQQWLIAGCLGWRLNGLPRTRMAIVQVARKNGKSTLAAGMCLFELLGRRVPGRAVHVIANKREQARIVLDTARQMAERIDGAAVLYNRIRCEYGEMDAQVSRDRSLDGLNPSLWIGDEVSEWRGRFITKLTTSTVGREDALGVLISTPGNCPDLVYPEMVATAEKVLLGETELDSWFPLLYGIDEGDDIADPTVWAKANPSLGASLKLETLQAQWQQMSLTPMGRVEFTRFHCARQTDVVGRWLDMKHWDEAGGDPVEIPDGAQVWLGVDLSKSQDLSALVICHPRPDGIVELAGRYWYPEQHAREREIMYSAPFKRWSLEGRMTLTPGGEVSWEAIRQEILQLCSRYNVQHVAVDPWASTYFIETLLLDGVPVVTHKQSLEMMAAASQDWQNLWVARRFRHGGDPVLRMCAANAGIWTDNNGNFRPVKDRSRGLIDGLVAAMMSVHAWSLSRGTAPSMYEQGVGV